MKMKVSELEDVQLNYLIAKAVGKDVTDVEFVLCYNVDDPDHEFLCPKGRVIDEIGAFQMDDYQPSTDWGQGGPLIEAHGINTKVHCSTNGKPDSWVAHKDWPMNKESAVIGSTPLIAAMRCIIASKYGKEVEVGV